MGGRLLIKLKALEPGSTENISKHSVQAFIYSCLRGTDFEFMHAMKGFKFFTFSDFWPSGEFSEEKTIQFIFSSAIDGLVRSLEEGVPKEGKIGPYRFEIEKRRIKQRVKVRWITGSPIVLYLNKELNVYMSPERVGILSYLNRLQENCIKKFKAFYGEDPEIPGPIFDFIYFWKTVKVIVKKGEKEFLVIGTKWKTLSKYIFDDCERKFYEFLYYAGLGEKTSLGFGLVNEIEEKRKDKKIDPSSGSRE